MLPEYTNSLHLRYPPVCASCLPLVEEEINSKDHMARTAALGGWLKQSKGKEKQRRESDTTALSRKFRREMFIWRFRGCLWATTLASAMIGYTLGRSSCNTSGPYLVDISTGVLDYRIPFPSEMLPPPSLPAVAFLSILWTVWDPTYSSLRKARLQGREVRQIGKKQYIVRVQPVCA